MIYLSRDHGLSSHTISDVFELSAGIAVGKEHSRLVVSTTAARRLGAIPTAGTGGDQPARPPGAGPTCHQTRKDFLVGRTWLPLWLKDDNQKTPSTCFDISKEKLFNFIF